MAVKWLSGGQVGGTVSVLHDAPVMLIRCSYSAAAASAAARKFCTVAHGMSSSEPTQFCLPAGHAPLQQCRAYQHFRWHHVFVSRSRREPFPYPLHVTAGMCVCVTGSGLAQFRHQSVLCCTPQARALARDYTRSMHLLAEYFPTRFEFTKPNRFPSCKKKRLAVALSLDTRNSPRCLSVTTMYNSVYLESLAATCHY
eukprot:scpid52070/ scgid8448/ 